MADRADHVDRTTTYNVGSAAGEWSEGNPDKIRVATRLCLELMLCHPLMLSVYSWPQVLDKFLAFGAAIAFSAGSSTRVQGMSISPGVQSNWGRRRHTREDGQYTIDPGVPNSPRIRNMRRSRSRTTDTTVGVQTEINGAAAELCCATIRFSCSASIDEVQKMLQWHPPASSLWPQTWSFRGPPLRCSEYLPVSWLAELLQGRSRGHKPPAQC